VFRFSSLICAGLVALSGAAKASETIYDCSPNNIESYLGWIADRVIVIVDEEKKTAFVLDGYIQHVHEQPIPASYSKLGNGNIRVKWNVSGIPMRATATGSASWSATIDPKKAQMRIRATVHGYDNRPSGQGKCEISSR